MIIYSPENSDRILFVYEKPEGREVRGFNPELRPKTYGHAARAGIQPSATFLYKPTEEPGKESNQRALRRFQEALDLAQPRVIVAFGSTVAKVLKLGAKITMNHGQVIELDGRHYLPVFGDGFVFRYPEKEEDLKRDLDRAYSILRNGASQPEAHWDVVHKGNIEEFFESLKGVKEFAFDLETSGLNWFEHDSYITCVGLAFDNRAWVIPMTMPNSPFQDPELQLRMMDLVFDALDKVPGIAHNGKFDNLWLKAHYGRKFDLQFDTMLAHYILDENNPHGLKILARKYLGVADYDIGTSQKKGDTQPAELYQYNALDCLYTLELKRLLRLELNKDLWSRRIFNFLLMPAARMFEEVDGNGLYLDLQKFRETRAQVSRDLRKAQEELIRLAGREVNWNSPSQVARLLYQELGLKASVKTASGAWSTGEEALLALGDQHEIIPALFRYRELEKFRSTYLDGWTKFMVDRKVYFSTKISGTVTGRFSSRLHQVPRDGTIRNLVTAPKGWTFVQADFSQAELRVAAILADDRELKRCYLRKIDVHWRTFCDNVKQSTEGKYAASALETASALAGHRVTDLGKALDLMLEAGHEACIAIDPGWKEGRKKAKGINFGLLYGQSAPGLRRFLWTKFQIDISEDEAVASRNAFFRTYSSLERWHQKQKRTVNRDQEVVSLMGRRRRLPHIKSPESGIRAEAERQAINSPVQGFIGDLKAAAMIEIYETISQDEIRVVGEVHDSILMWVRDDYHHRLEDVRKIMEDPALLRKFRVKLDVPITADIELGPWGKGEAV